MALPACERNVAWIQELVWKLVHGCRWIDGSMSEPTQVNMSLRAAVTTSSRNKLTKFNKQTGMRLRRITNLLMDEIMYVNMVPFDLQLAEVLTKPSTVTFLPSMIQLLRLSLRTMQLNVKQRFIGIRGKYCVSKILNVLVSKHRLSIHLFSTTYVHDVFYVL